MKRIIALTLILLLLLALCACGEEKDAPSTPTELNGSYVPSDVVTKPTEKTENKTEKPESTPADRKETTVQTPTLEDKFAAKWESASQEAQAFSNDAGTSIDVLREEITNAGARFGVGYVGYFEYIEETGIDFGQWYYGASALLAAQYPFVSEIDAAHTIGDEGHLYCILADDFAASIEVNDTDGETLYRAENGDPILLFCNRDGDAQTADITVTVTAMDGSVYTYTPTLDELGFPQLLIGDERQLLSWDFTPIPDDGFDLTNWLADGWGGVTAVGLAYDENGTSWWIDTWDGSVSYCLNFYLLESGDYDGEVVLECFYKDDPTLQAEWQGWWSIDTELDQPSRLNLSLALMNGADKASFQDVSVVTESYLAMVPLSGEYLLLVADGKNAALPIFPEGTQAVELTLAMG